MNFAEARKAAEAAGLISGGGDFYKLKEGDNRVRLVSECLPHRGTYKGEKTFKWLCYVLDRRDNTVKAFFMPHTIYKAIEALQSNPDYAFDSIPMPYDVTLTAKGAGTKDVEYGVIPARKETELTAEEYDAIAEAKPIKDLQDALVEKQNAKQADEPPF